MDIISHRIDFGKIQGPLADFLNNNEKFQILDNKKANFYDKEIPPIADQATSANSIWVRQCYKEWSAHDAFYYEQSPNSNYLTLNCTSGSRCNWVGKSSDLWHTGRWRNLLWVVNRKIHCAA